MASRQEEKEQRKAERLAQEESDRKAAARTRRLQMVFGGVLAAAVIAAVLIVITSSGGNSNGDGNGTVQAAKKVAGVNLPKQQTSDEAAAAKDAGCQLTNPADEGRSHEDKVFTEKDYKTNPPTSGNHFPEWAQDGIYAAGNEPQLGKLVHTLEHGRIDVQYKPGSSPELVKQLEQFVAENDGYHMLLFQNPTKMQYAVAATAWDHALLCPTVNDKTWDALRTFRDDRIDKGPEKVA